MKPSRPRGRPRSIDPARLRRAVSDAFWSKGYAAASLDDLAAAAGVTRPSLYAALGDKQAMYLGAIADVEKALRRQIAVALDPARPLADALQAFYDYALRHYVSGEDGQRGCLVICTAAAEAVEDLAIRRALARVIRLIDQAFEACFTAARPDDDPAMLAKLASATLHTLAIRARAGTKPAELRALAADAVRHLARVR